jgi:hypothetical protein
VTVKGTVAAKESGGPMTRSTDVAVVVPPWIWSDGTVDASIWGVRPEAKKAEGYTRSMLPPASMPVFGVNDRVTVTLLLPCTRVRGGGGG